MSWSSLIYAFGIINANQTLLPEDSEALGMEDATCYIIKEDRLGMIVCQVNKKDYNEEDLHVHLDDIAWVETHARRHEEVLLKWMKTGSVIPLPFCTLFTGTESVKSQLLKNKGFLEAQLEQLTNHHEMHIKLYCDVKRLKTKIEEEIPFTGGSGGSSYFLKRQWESKIENECQQTIDNYGEMIYQVLKELASGCNLLNRAEVVPPDNLRVVFSAQYLLHNDFVAQWEEKIVSFDQAADPWGFILNVSGPWPLYHFSGVNGGD